MIKMVTRTTSVKSFASDRDLVVINVLNILVKTVQMDANHVSSLSL